MQQQQHPDADHEMARMAGEEFRRIQKLNAALDRQMNKYRDALSAIAAASDPEAMRAIAVEAINRTEEIKRTLNDKILPHVERIKTSLRNGNERAKALVELHQRHLFDPGDADAASQCEAALSEWLHSTQ